MSQVIQTHRRRTYLTGPVKPESRRSRVSAMERINVSTDVRTNLDTWYGSGASVMLGLGVHKEDLHQPVLNNGKTPEAPMIDKNGVRRSAGYLFVVVLALILAISLLSDLGGLWSAQRNLADVRRDITQIRADNDELILELDAKERGINIGFEAAKMGLISSAAEPAITLTIPGVYGTTTANMNIDTDAMAILGD